MSHLRHVGLVAGWEFQRYFKWKDQIIGLLVFLVLSGAGYAVSRMMSAGRGPIVVATSGVELSAPAGSGVVVVPAPDGDAARAALLRDGDAHGILTRMPDGTFSLLVEKAPRNVDALWALVGEQVRRERLAASGLSEEELARILSPPQVAMQFTNPDRRRTSRAEIAVAGIFQGIMLLVVFTSMAFLLTGITGEKQLRVTESITAIIRPQAWIDGKILGICAYALTSIANMTVGALLLALAAKAAWGFSLPDAVVRPGVLLVLAVYALLGLILWNAFFAAFAATIDDPNTSARTSAMFVPMIPVGLAMTVLRDPDHITSRMLAIFPLTSPSALPARMLLSDPGIAEIGVSVLLLAATIWLVRRLAGRIFEIGMLMYGKEPTLREMWRWATAASRERLETAAPDGR